MCAQCLATPRGDALPPATREAYRQLYAHWQGRGFHCADAVFAELGRTVPAPPELRDATTAFMGGTLFTGMTCSALTAGVMALGLARGEIEDSRPRVLRMMGTMAVGGDASADHLNAFNPVMNLGHKLAKWFNNEFASTQCRALTGCDLASTSDVRDYIANDETTSCTRIAECVAARVAEIAAAPVKPQQRRSNGSTCADQTTGGIVA
jgi:hypothetical protein